MERTCPTCTLICRDLSRTECELCDGSLPTLELCDGSLPTHAPTKRPLVIDLTEDEETRPPKHASKECPICLDILGSDGGVQALGCMDTFCRGCIATHLTRDAHCPLCKYPVPDVELRQVGPGRVLVDSDSESEGEEDSDEGGEEEDSDEGGEEEDSDEGGENGGDEGQWYEGRWYPQRPATNDSTHSH